MSELMIDTSSLGSIRFCVICSKPLLKEDFKAANWPIEPREARTCTNLQCVCLFQKHVKRAQDYFIPKLAEIEPSSFRDVLFHFGLFMFTTCNECEIRSQCHGSMLNDNMISKIQSKLFRCKRVLKQLPTMIKWLGSVNK